MPLGIGIGQIVALVREMQARRVERRPHRRLRHPGRTSWRRRCAEGGDAGAVVVGGDPRGAAVAVGLLDGDPSAADNDAPPPDRAARASR